MSEPRLPPPLPGTERRRPQAPDDLEIELVVNRVELQILYLAVWEFLHNPGASRTPGTPPPSHEWLASEFHSVVGTDIGVGEALKERLRAIKLEVDAPFAEGHTEGTQLPLGASGSGILCRGPVPALEGKGG